MDALIFWLWPTFVFGVVIVFALYITRNDRKPHDPAE